MPWVGVCCSYSHAHFDAPPQCWEALLSDGDRLSLWETAKARWLRMLSDRMRGSGAGWLWFVEFQRRRGAPHLHVLIQLDVPFLSAPEYADWQRWLTESWGRCLGLPCSLCNPH